MSTKNVIGRILGMASLAGMLALGACGGGSSSNPKTDGPAVIHDLSVVTGGTSCSTIFGGAEGCGSDATCIKGFIDAGSPAAQAAFEAIITCGYEHCASAADAGSSSDSDAGAAKCATSSDESSTCVQCEVSEALANCSAQIQACQAS